MSPPSLSPHSILHISSFSPTLSLYLLSLFVYMHACCMHLQEDKGHSTPLPPFKSSRVEKSPPSSSSRCLEIQYKMHGLCTYVNILSLLPIGLTYFLKSHSSFLSLVSITFLPRLCTQLLLTPYIHTYAYAHLPLIGNPDPKNPEA